MNRAISLIVGLVLTTALAVVAPSGASTSYGHTSVSVAERIHCLNPHQQGDFEVWSGSMKGTHCTLKGHKAIIVTFKSKTQQTKWERFNTQFAGPSWHWSRKPGAAVYAQNGNLTVAKIGAHRLPGVVKHA